MANILENKNTLVGRKAEAQESIKAAKRQQKNMVQMIFKNFTEG